MLRTLASFVILSGALLLGATEGSAQTLAGLKAGPPTGAILRAEDLHEALKPGEALVLLESVLQQDPQNYNALWRAAREAVNLGMLDRDPGAAKVFYDRAEVHARIATEVDPDGVDGQHYLAVALGRQALSEGIRTRVQLAEEVRSQAELVLRMDSTYAAAYHVLGVWNAEVKRLDRFSRFVARRIMGGDRFGQASWEAAEGSMRRAVELEPDVIMHRLELAKILLDIERDEEARAERRKTLDLPIQEPIDPLLQQEAQDLLRDLAGS